MTPEFGTHRTAIVTGGGQRIGAAIVRALAADGWYVLVHCNRSVSQAKELAAGLTNAHVVGCDLAEADCALPIFAAAAEMPPVGLLVNNASLFALDDLADFDAAAWDRHFAVNARAPALLTQAFAEAMPDGKGGLIVNLHDAKLEFPNPDFFTYTLSKMALAGLTELSARRLAARAIRVAAIAPSVTLVSGPQSRDNFDEVHRLNALRRGIDVDQIVAALRFIIATPTFTGQTITLDGGQRFLGLPRDVQFLETQ